MRKIVVLMILYVFPVNISANNYKTESIQYGFSIQDLLLFKNATNGQIHDYLIMKDWEYVSTHDKRSGGGFSPMNIKTITYENRYFDIKIHIIETTFYRNIKRDTINKVTKEIIVETESSEIHKYMLQDLYKNGYSSKGEPSNGVNSEVFSLSAFELNQKMKKEFVKVETSSRYYYNQKNNVTITTEVLQKYNSYGDKIIKNIYKLNLIY